MLEFEQMCKNVLQPYSLQSKAAYLNSIEDTVMNWQKAYYGDNYKRLMKIKETWDPDRFWWFPQAIGESGAEAPIDGQLPGRWEPFSVNDPSAINAAGNNIKSVLRANLAIRNLRILRIMTGLCTLSDNLNS